MTWPVLAFLLTAVFALGFHVGQKLALAETAGVEPDAPPQPLTRKPMLPLSHHVVRRSI